MTRPKHLTLDLVTPENVELPFEVASVSHRILALIIDLIVMFLLLLAIGILLFVGLALAFTSSGMGEYVVALVLVLSFFVRNFYFALSELHWRGQTIGKRSLGVRVVARDGGPLTAKMIFARNLTRDLEIFLPAIALMSPKMLFPAAPWWARLVCIAWILILAFIPAFNRQRARLGDLVAGTVVVVAPQSRLLPDLMTTRSPAWHGAAEEQFHFTREQLEIYGIKELQVLEDVLRRDFVAPDLLADISERIKRKIGWDLRYWNVPSEPFLRAFYKAQRGRLEQKMLFGKRQEKKVR